MVWPVRNRDQSARRLLSASRSRQGGSGPTLQTKKAGEKCDDERARGAGSVLRCPGRPSGPQSDARLHNWFELIAFSEPSYALALAAIDDLGSIRAADKAASRRENLG